MSGLPLILPCFDRRRAWRQRSQALRARASHHCATPPQTGAAPHPLRAPQRHHMSEASRPTMASESADGSNSAWWGFRRDEVASEASTEGGESGASSVAPSTCSEQPNVATLSRGNVCDVCGDDLPSRMTVCAACWFKKWQAVASLGHFSKPAVGSRRRTRLLLSRRARIPRRRRRPHRAVPTSK